MLSYAERPGIDSSIMRKRVQRLRGPKVAIAQKPTRKIEDVRHTRNIEELLPPNAGSYRDELLDILSRMDNGYWPTVDVGVGWYSLVCKLNEELRGLDPNYKIKHVGNSQGALDFFFATSDIPDERARKMMNLVIVARGRSQCICEECGSTDNCQQDGDGGRVLCSTHLKPKRRRTKKEKEYDVEDIDGRADE